MYVIRLFVYKYIRRLLCIEAKSVNMKLSSNLFAIKIKHLQILNNEQIKDDSEVLKWIKKKKGLVKQS